ncbi:MAG: hypothetical protein FWC09_11185, partial [Lachnospiraceae bacterium]|nr:hypothetical protein [Lachnospiraceae bacterium]
MAKKEDISKFEKQIKITLSKMSYDERRLFAWLCAVRVLPLLTVRTCFSYWKEDVQKHLLNVFRALDIAAITNSTAAVDAAYAVANTAARAAAFAAFATATEDACAAADAAAYAAVATYT